MQTRTLTRGCAAILLTLLPRAVHAGDEPDPSWLDAVRTDIVEREYDVTWQDGVEALGGSGAWHAPNRAHGLRTYFLPDGIRVMPREEVGAWELSLHLARWGRPGAPLGVGSARISASGNRLDYDRETVSEWYRNDRRGLEQGFEIALPPSTGRGRAALDLAMAGPLSPIAAEDGQAIDFVAPRGARVARLGSLHVEDAAGRVLPSRMEGFAEPELRGIRLVYDDTDALYPVTVDPILTGPTWTGEIDQSFAGFGWSVATAGDVNGDGFSDLVVGAPFYDNGQTDEGRAVMYLGRAAGPSVKHSWSVEGNQAGAKLGAAVATAGDVNGDGYSDIVVGASEYDNGQTDEGRALVYLGSATGLSTTPAWTGESDQDGAAFGRAVGTAGDVNGDGYSDLVVGARLYNSGQIDDGRAYVYLGSATGLSLTAAWTASSGQSSAYFGVAVGTAGDVNGDGYADLIVGADSYDEGQANEGKAFLYLGSAAGLAATAAWTIQSDQADADLGYAVGTAGDVNGDGYSDVVVGAPWYDSGSTDGGRAFVALGSATGLGGVVWTASSLQASAFFGHAVGTAGDVNGDGYADVVVGAYGYDNVFQGGGRTFVYLGSAGGLSTAADFTNDGSQTDAALGIAVATAGDVNGDGYADLVVGATGYDNGQTDEGAALLYLGSAAGPAAVAGWTKDAGQSGAHFGYSVATAGDVNADGFADVLVGATQYDNGQTDEGQVFLYLGSADGLATSASTTLQVDQAGARYGSSVATAGDVNGDGYDDYLVGASAFDNGLKLDAGRASLVYGSPSSLVEANPWVVTGDQQNGHLGIVASAGDVNGDGYADVLLGEPDYDNGDTNGRVRLYLGSPDGLSTSASWTRASDEDLAGFGWAVASAGDVNGDGYSDVVVGAPFHDTTYDDAGRAYVYLGSAFGLLSTPAWTVDGTSPDGELGVAVGSAGDVNGDGYADVIVGEVGWDFGLYTDAGRATVYLGSAMGLSATPAWTAYGGTEQAYFGRSVGTAGDVNGDGYADVIVGADGFWNVESGEGGAFVYLGSAAGLATTPSWTAEPNQSGAHFGRAVATAGDVNGDGYSDVIVGAPDHDHLGFDVGQAFLYYGNGRGVASRPQQRRSDDTSAIARLGKSDASDAFRIAALGRSPLGRTKVKLETEVKPFGTYFDGTATGTSSVWTDTGVSGAALSRSSTGLVATTPYHWRARVRYASTASPFAQHGPWRTVPWGGWQEWMLRTPRASGAAGSVPDGSSGAPFTISKSFPVLTLRWEPSCNPGDDDFEVYQGTLGSFTSHVPIFCSTFGSSEVSILVPAANSYYLVVPRNAAREGSYGRTSAGTEIPASASACLPQEIAICP